MALMNLFLHNIGDTDSERVMISPNDSLVAASETRYDYVLAIPPFSKKSNWTKAVWIYDCRTNIHHT